MADDDRRGTPRWQLAALAACVAVIGGWSANRAGSDVAVTERVEVACLDGSAVERVRSDPAAFTGVASDCRSEVRAALQDSWPDHAVDAVTASLVAHRMAPYGTVEAKTTEELLAAERQHCGTYALLMMDLLSEIGEGATSSMWMLGFHGGAVGYHGQVMFHGGNEDGPHLLIDPTVGIVAAVTFDDLLSGVPSGRVVDMGAWSDDAWMENFRRRVVGAVDGGRYRPSDLLYRFEDIDGLGRWWGEIGRLDPSAPTPGIPGLRDEIGWWEKPGLDDGWVVPPIQSS